jgi:cytochrome P450
MKRQSDGAPAAGPGEGSTAPVTCPVNDRFDPLSDEFLADPYPHLARLRESTPVFYASVLDRWVVTRYDEIEQVLQDPTTFSAAEAQRTLYPVCEDAGAVLRGAELVPVLSNCDPPAHRRYRQVMARALSPRRMAVLGAAIGERSGALLETFAGDGRADLVGRLFYPLPALTMFTLIGLPLEDADRIKEWGEDKIVVNWGRPSPAAQMRSALSMVAYWRYCLEFVRSRRMLPRDDLTSDLLANEEMLSDEEVASLIFAVSFAGHETTTSLLGNVMHQLLRRPKLWEEVCADRSLIDGAVEETLRYDTPVPAWRRITTRATTISGVRVPAGARLILSFGAGNRDPERFSDPECFDMRRADARRQISFGKGIHYCLGAALARLEARIVLDMLADRLAGLRLAQEESLRFSPNISFRGPLEMWVEWGVSAPGDGGYSSRGPVETSTIAPRATRR